jgi:hypothetical protein
MLFIIMVCLIVGPAWYECGKVVGEFHDQGDAKWIVIRGHNNMPFGRPTSSRPIGHPVVSCPQGVFGGLSYYPLITKSAGLGVGGWNGCGSGVVVVSITRP